MITIINGPYRTGSTVIYQMTRDLLIAHNPDAFCNFDALNSFENMELTKVHNYLAKNHLFFPTDEQFEEHNIKLIGTSRNLYDVVYSHLFMYGFTLDAPVERLKFTINNLFDKHRQFRDKWFECYHKYPQSCLLFQYEDFYEDNFNTISRIQRFLGIDVDDAKLSRIANDCSVSNIKKIVGDKPIKEEIAYVQFRKGHIGPSRGLPYIAFEKLPDNLKQAVDEIVRGE